MLSSLATRHSARASTHAAPIRWLRTTTCVRTTPYPIHLDKRGEARPPEMGLAFSLLRSSGTSVLLFGMPGRRGGHEHDSRWRRRPPPAMHVGRQPEHTKARRGAQHHMDRTAGRAQICGWDWAAACDASRSSPSCRAPLHQTCRTPCGGDPRQRCRRNDRGFSPDLLHSELALTTTCFNALHTGASARSAFPCTTAARASAFSSLTHSPLFLRRLGASLPTQTPRLSSPTAP